MPDFKFVFVVQPNFFNLLVSSSFLGVPSGFRGSNTILPEYSTISQIILVSSAIEI